VIATLISVFLYALDNTVVADIVPAIVNDFDRVSDLPWLSVGFALGGITLAMPFGKLFGLCDAKWLYITCVVIFMDASALCGAAPNMDAEIVGRVLAGAGGNGMYLGVLTLLLVNTSDTERPVYLSLVGVFFGVGTVLGPIIGGGFEKYTWRWAL
jgi:MFS family permease